MVLVLLIPLQCTDLSEVQGWSRALLGTSIGFERMHSPQSTGRHRRIPVYNPTRGHVPKLCKGLPNALVLLDMFNLFGMANQPKDLNHPNIPRGLTMTKWSGYPEIL